MKKELLEHLIRHCIREVITQMNETDDIKGAAAPPADGQGTADQPAVPKQELDENLQKVIKKLVNNILYKR